MFAVDDAAPAAIRRAYNERANWLPSLNSAGIFGSRQTMTMPECASVRSLVGERTRLRVLRLRPLVTLAPTHRPDHWWLLRTDRTTSEVPATLNANFLECTHAARVSPPPMSRLGNRHKAWFGLEAKRAQNAPSFSAMSRTLAGLRGTIIVASLGTALYPLQLCLHRCRPRLERCSVAAVGYRPSIRTAALAPSSTTSSRNMLPFRRPKPFSSKRRVVTVETASKCSGRLGPVVGAEFAGPVSAETSRGGARTPAQGSGCHG